MKRKIYYLPTLIIFAMVLLLSCQSKVQEDNTAYERFKQKKLKEKENIVPVVAAADTLVSDSFMREEAGRKAAPATVLARASKSTANTEDRMALEEELSSAQIPQASHKAVDIHTAPSETKKKVGKEKKNIVWPKINKITLKKKKKEKNEYTTELEARK